MFFFTREGQQTSTRLIYLCPGSRLQQGEGPTATRASRQPRVVESVATGLGAHEIPSTVWSSKQLEPNFACTFALDRACEMWLSLVELRMQDRR
eukprot:5011714-Prymnesium_polylepis.2